MKKGSKRATILAFLAFLNWSGGISLAVDPTENPILIIPGILGSQLWARLNRTSVNHIYCQKQSDWYNLWLSLEQLVYPIEKCASDNSMLHYDPSTKTFSNTEGVEIETRDFGNTSSVEFLDPSLDIDITNYFHDMVKHFSKLGYIRGQTIRAAPYDWRFAPYGLTMQGYFDNVKKLVEDMYNDYHHPITLIVHSMGGPISLYFLTQVVSEEWKLQHIKQYISLSSVWAGCLVSVQSIISGDNEGIILDKQIWGRASARSYQTTLWLLPPPGDVWSKDQVLAYTPQGNYTAYDYQKLFRDLKLVNHWEKYQLILDATSHFPPPNVTTYCFYGLGKDTPYKLEYSAKNYPDSPPNVITCDGDGTVPKVSLTVCERWKTQQPFNVYTKGFSPVEHVHMLKNEGVIDAVSEIITSS